MRIDLHVHTTYSPDAFMSPKEAVEAAKKIGLDGIAITDHNSIKAHQHTHHFRGTLVIPGIEVSSNEGHILGLNVSEVIPPRLSAAETIEKIRGAGGIAIAPHPYLKRGSVGSGAIARLNFDAIETVNSSTFPFFLATKLSSRLASRLGLPVTGGSDSHFTATLGLAYTLVDVSSTSIDDILDAIRRGRSKAFGRPRRVVDRLRKAASWARLF